MIKTVGDLIKALGGTTAVSEFLGVGPSAVSNALADGKLRERWKYRLSRECARRNLLVDRKLFDEPVKRRRRKAA